MVPGTTLPTQRLALVICTKECASKLPNLYYTHLTRAFNVETEKDWPKTSWITCRSTTYLNETLIAGLRYSTFHRIWQQITMVTGRHSTTEVQSTIERQSDSTAAGHCKTIDLTSSGEMVVVIQLWRNVYHRKNDASDKNRIYFLHFSHVNDLQAPTLVINSSLSAWPCN